MIDIGELKDVLEEKILSSEKVIIVPHNNADFDAIGSAIGLSLIPKRLGKQYFIVMNDALNTVDYGVKLIFNECINEYNIVNKNIYAYINSLNDLFILTDVNKKNLICIPDLIKDPDRTLIVDHHDCGVDTIKSNNIYTDSTYSSASEIVSILLCENNINIPSNVANYLYAGIYLDTAKLTKNCTAETMNMVARLIEFGANVNVVNEYFKEDFISDRKVQSLINNIKMLNFVIAMVVANEDTIYSREEIAKASDYALKYGADAAFAIGKIEDNVVSISGRSNEKINIGSIMNELGGGGNPYMGAAKISDISVDEASNNLKKVLRPKYFIK